MLKKRKTHGTSKGAHKKHIAQMTIEGQSLHYRYNLRINSNLNTKISKLKRKMKLWLEGRPSNQPSQAYKVLGER